MHIYITTAGSLRAILIAMRFVIFFSTLCFALVVVLAYSFLGDLQILRLASIKQQVFLSLDEVSAKLHDLRYHKDIKYDGLTGLEPFSVEPLLPLHKSVNWWNFHAGEIQGALMRHPLVKEARITRCTFLSWGCFEVQIVERRPALLAGLKNQIWILGSDGSFVSPFKDSVIQRARLRVDPKSLPRVKGLIIGDDSPQLIQGRARYVSGVIDHIHQNSSYIVDKIELKKNGECIVGFKDVPFPVVFGASHERNERLFLELRRFKIMASRLKEHLLHVDRVDLAFENLAVVRFKDASLVPEFS